MRQFYRGVEIETLVEAMRTGRELKSLIKDKKSLADYPAYSPVFALQEILVEVN